MEGKNRASRRESGEDLCCDKQPLQRKGSRERSGIEADAQRRQGQIAGDVTRALPGFAGVCRRRLIAAILYPILRSLSRARTSCTASFRAFREYAFCTKALASLRTSGAGL